jgi:hypothetical protein
MEYFLSEYTYIYPKNNVAVKNARQDAHTPALPPRYGNTCFPVIGSTEKRRNALQKIRSPYIFALIVFLN